MKLANLIKYIEPIFEDALGRDAHQRFSEQAIRIIPVINHSNEIIGILERGEFLAKMAKNFGRDIYENRKVLMLMKPVGIILKHDDTLDVAALKLSQARHDTSLPCAVVYRRDEYIGIADAPDIYLSLAKSWNARALAYKKAKQHAEAARDAKMKFLATMSHEIRTPLNGIIGMVQALSQQDMHPKHLEMIQIINSSSKMLTNIVNDVLDIAKIDADKIDIIHTDCVIYETFFNCINLFLKSAQNKNIDLICEISAIKNLIVKTDDKRIAQIVNNLLSNSIKFTKEGFVKLESNIKDKKLYVAITDTGIGMSKEFLENISEPFHQADASITRNYGGTGLGLNIVYKLIKLMNGTINVTSEVGKGSCFEIIIPVEVNEVITPAPIPEIEKPKTNKIENENAANQKEQSIRLLVAEDNKINIMVIKTLLEPFDFDISYANNGHEALRMRFKDNFDLILMDLQMPIMDGFTSTIKIRKIEKRLKLPEIPIIAVSANAIQEQINHCINVGMNSHVAKPIDLRELLNKVECCLDDYEETHNNLKSA